MEDLDHKRKITIMISIMAAMLFAALNQTIIGTALPRIVSELGGMEYFNWVFTIFMLASSVTAILVGKLSDIYGRKRFILTGIGVFILGSFLCGLSTSIVQLIIYRGIQGLGGGMIMSTAFTAVGDLFPPRERGRWQGLMGSVFGLASVFGPTLGGYIVDHAAWQWVFWIFLPVGFIALALIWWMFPSVAGGKKSPIDYWGSILITCTIIPLLLALSWGGEEYAWQSLVIIGLLTISIMALISFIIVEQRVQSPVVPLSLFKNSVFTLSNVIGFIMGIGMFGTIMYMPFFVQGVMGTSALASGFIMMPMTLSMVTASAISGQLITKTGKYKKLALGGLMVMAAGMLSMSFMNMDTTPYFAVFNLIIVGLGLGTAFPIFTITVQNAVEHRFLGVATATSQLCRQLGGTVGVSVMGTIMSMRLSRRIEQDLSSAEISDLAQLQDKSSPALSDLQNPQLLMDPSQLRELQSSLPANMQETFTDLIMMLREALSFSLVGVFLTGSIVVFSAVVLTSFLREIPLRTTNRTKNERQEVEEKREEANKCDQTMSE